MAPIPYFKDKVVWITGASSGIGKELALQLNLKGAKIIASARNEQKLNIIKAEAAFEENFKIVALDLEKSENFPNKLQEVLSLWSTIDILINNGGISQRSEASETQIEIDRKIMEVNYFGNIALTKIVLPIMQAKNSGQIVVISSIAGKFGFYLRSAYAASKHALQGFYESLRLEEEKNNIHVTIVFPGKIKTDISVNALNGEGKSYEKMDDNQAEGMAAEKCASIIIKSINKKKRDVLIGGKEIKAVLIKRLLPSLFYNIIKKQKAT